MKNNNTATTKLYQLGKAFDSDKIPVYPEQSKKSLKNIKPNESKKSAGDSPSVRIVFMGTSLFAKIILEALVKSNHIIAAIVTQPDTKSHGKNPIKPNPVKELATLRNIPLLQPVIFDKETISQIKKHDPDILVVAAFGKILSREVLEIPPKGALNVHASLLPKYRGPSPIQNALMSGEEKTGVTIILMNEEIDAGDILAQEQMEISPDDNSETLHQKLSSLGAELLLRTIPMWISKEIKPAKQDESQATLCQLVEREDGRIIWEEKAEKIFNMFRALFPWPGIFTFWKKDDAAFRIKLTKVSLEKNNPQTSHRIGEVFQLGDKIGVQTIEGIIILEEIQIESKKPASIADFLNGYPDFIGSVLV